MREALFSRLARVMPPAVQGRVKALGAFRLLTLFYDKRGAELLFQKQWAEEFRQSREQVAEYWREYRGLDEIISTCRLQDDSRVLDVGCGISTVLHFVPGLRVGIDPLAKEYKRLYSYPPELSIEEGTGEALPFLDRSFDVVFCSNVLDHVADPARTLAEIRRVCRPEGYFILTVEIFPQRGLRDPAHPHSLTESAAKALLATGFQIVWQRRAPWIGLRNYVHGLRAASREELVLVCRKPPA